MYEGEGEEERTKIKTRLAEGIASAKAQCKHLGRPKTSITSKFEQAYKEWKAGEITAVEAMKESSMTFEIISYFLTQISAFNKN